MNAVYDRARQCAWNLLLAAVSVLSAPTALAVGADAPGLRVMGFNVRYATDADGDDRWEQRRDLLVDTILRHRPDLIGTQELLRGQAKFLDAHLHGYAWFGTGRNGDDSDGDGNEHMGVFYDTRRFELLGQGHFWLSATPDVPGSDNFGRQMPRMATWGRFRDRQSGGEFHLFNTHFPHMADAEPLRVKSAEVLLARIDALPNDVPVVVTGDFNALPGAATHRRMTAGLHDVREAAVRRSGPDGTVHAFSGTPAERIDWILVRGFDVARTETVTDHAGARYPSDHFPVVADLAWPARD